MGDGVGYGVGYGMKFHNFARQLKVSRQGIAEITVELKLFPVNSNLHGI